MSLKTKIIITLCFLGILGVLTVLGMYATPLIQPLEPKCWTGCE